MLSRIIHLLYKELQNILCEFILNKIDYIRNKRVGIEEYRKKSDYNVKINYETPFAR